MKILVVPTTDWLGHPVLERQHHIFERLAQRHEVYILRFRYYNEKKQNTKAIVYEMDDNMTNSLAIYYLVNITKHWKAIREIVKTNEIDVVVLSNLLPAYTTIKALRNVPSVFDLSDHFPTSGTGYVFDVHSTVGKLASKMLEALLKSILKSVDCTVVCSFPLKNYAEGLGARSVTLVPNGVDEVFLERKHNGANIRQRYGLEGSVVVGFVGMIEFWLDMTPLLRAIKEIERKEEIKLFIVGERFQTRAQFDVQTTIEKLKISENVVWLDSFVPYQELPDFIDAMDICTIPFNCNHPTAYFSAPNKLWEYLALGKPVVTSPLPDVLAQVGKFVNVAVTSKDYIRIIGNYIANSIECKARAKQCKRFIRQERTWTKISKEYERLLLDTSGRERT